MQDFAVQELENIWKCDDQSNIVYNYAKPRKNKNNSGQKKFIF